MSITSDSTSPSPCFTGMPSLHPERPCVDATAHDPHVPQQFLQDPAFIRSVSAALMQKCVLHRWVPEDDPRVEDVLPPPIVEALRLAPQDRNAIGMADALLALVDLQERYRVLVQMILTLRVLR